MNRGLTPLIVIIVAIIAGIGYWVWAQKPAAETTAVFSASPTSGIAPLSVDFKISATDSSDDSGVYYTIVFGDSEAGGFPRTSAPSLSHVYDTPGTYTVVATRMTQCSSWECLGPSTEAGTATITVR